MDTNVETSGSFGASYEEVRKAGRELIPKIYKSPISKEYDMVKAAKMLTLPVRDRTLLFDGETDMGAHADFWIHEFRRAGKTMIERCRPDELGLSPLEADLLLAHQRARTSLFEVIEALPSERLLRLRDLLEPERAEARLTDVNLSASIGGADWQHPPLMFFRILALQGYEMTSGVSFTFEGVHKQALLAAYEERMNRVPPKDKAERRYVYFYRKQREIGVEQFYANVPGTT